jgi:hypothetical protein
VQVIAAGVVVTDIAEAVDDTAAGIGVPVDEAGAQEARIKAQTRRKNPDRDLTIATRFSGPGRPGVVGRNSF